MVTIGTFSCCILRIPRCFSHVLLPSCNSAFHIFVSKWRVSQFFLLYNSSPLFLKIGTTFVHLQSSEISLVFQKFLTDYNQEQMYIGLQIKKRYIEIRKQTQNWSFFLKLMRTTKILDYYFQHLQTTYYFSDDLPLIRVLSSILAWGNILFKVI